MTDLLQPIEQRVGAAGVELRVLRWLPPRQPAERAVPAGPAARSAFAAGRPAPFLLVHGLASNARLWDGVARRLAEAGHEAVSVDLRGHGQSSKPDVGYDFATIDGDLEAVVRSLGLDRPIAAGQSWGANVVLDLGVRCPDLVRGIVAVDGAVSDMQDRMPDWDQVWERLAPPQLVGTPLARIEGYFRTAHADWPEEGVAGALANFEIRPDGTIAPWLTRERHGAILRELWAHRPSRLWPMVQVPAILLLADAGDPGWTAEKRAGAERAAAALATSGVPHEVHWFRADHDLHAQHPDEVAALLLEAATDGLMAEAAA